MSSKDASAALFAWKFVEFYRWLVGTDFGRSLFIFALQLGIARAPPTPQWLMTCAIIDLHWLTTNYNWHRGPNWQDFWPLQFWISTLMPKTVVRQGHFRKKWLFEDNSNRTFFIINIIQLYRTAATYVWLSLLQIILNAFNLVCCIFIFLIQES